VLEASVLSGLRTHLMDPALFKEFCEEFNREINRLRIAGGAGLAAARSELERVERQIKVTIDAIVDGMYHASMKEKMTNLEARKAELTEQLAAAEVPPPLLHPNMAVLYRERISSLRQSLQAEATRAEAAELLRSLVDQITLVPEVGALSIVLRGDLAALLRFAADERKPGGLTTAGFFLVWGWIWLRGQDLNL
jgi:site-specific DNA recombinase